MPNSSSTVNICVSIMKIKIINSLLDRFILYTKFAD